MANQRLDQITTELTSMADVNRVYAINGANARAFVSGDTARVPLESNALSVVPEGSNFRVNDGTALTATVYTSLGLAVNAAMAINPARTAMQTVIVNVNGNIVTDPIEVPDWTELVINGNLTRTSGASIVQNADTVGGNNNITVRGSGTLDANLTGLCAAFTNVTSLVFKDLRLLNSASGNLALADCTDFLVTGIYSDNPNDDGIGCIGCVDGAITHNEITGGRGSGAPSSSGIELEDGCQRVSVIGNLVHDLLPVTNATGTAGAGIQIIADPTVGTPCEDINIIGNQVYNTDGGGIDFVCNNEAQRHKGGVIANNTVICDPGLAGGGASTNASDRGITVTAADGINVTGNTVKGSGGIGIDMNRLRGGTASFNTVQRALAEGIRAFRAQGCNVIGNTILDTTAAEWAIEANRCAGINISQNFVGSSLYGDIQNNVVTLTNASGTDAVIETEYDHGLSTSDLITVYCPDRAGYQVTAAAITAVTAQTITYTIPVGGQGDWVSSGINAERLEVVVTGSGGWVGRGIRARSVPSEHCIINGNQGYSSDGTLVFSTDSTDRSYQLNNQGLTDDDNRTA